MKSRHEQLNLHHCIQGPYSKSKTTNLFINLTLHDFWCTKVLSCQFNTRDCTYSSPFFFLFVLLL